MAAACLPSVSSADRWPDIEVREIKPWSIEVWERLQVKAPCPDKAQPYCCYLRTVIFYLRPYVVRPWSHLYEWRGGLAAERPGRHFEEWARCETRYSWDDLFYFHGVPFRIGGGRVEWRGKARGWWMKHNAHRGKKR